MKMLHQLAKELHANDYVMTDKIKDQFEEFLSIIAEGARIIHPRFGLGTVQGTQGNSWIEVLFDKEVADYTIMLKEWESKPNQPYWTKPSKPSKHVMISSCTSVRMLIKKESKYFL